MSGFVYILQSGKNGRFYIGSSNDVVRRKSEHDRGHVVATRNLRPLELVFFKEYSAVAVARTVEHWLKRLKDRRILERIIANSAISKDFTT